MDRDSIYKAFQEICRQVPVIILGSGVSCGAGLPGMEQLADRLINEMPKDINDSWSKIKVDLENKVALETALQKNIPDDDLEKEIIRIVGRYFAEKDLEIRNKYYSKQITVPIEKLINYFKSNILSIITPNYDCLVEYSCDKLCVSVNTGFVGYFRKSYNFEKAKRSMLYIESSTVKKGKKQYIAGRLSHVQLFKLHGSIDWYKIDGQIISDVALINDRSIDDKRQIITPGINKHKNTQTDPYRELMQKADATIKAGNSFLMIGYGFNDIHVQEYIVQRLQKDEKPGIIITRDFSGPAKDLLSSCPNLWGICNENNSSIIYHNKHGQYELENSEIWKIDKFVEEVLGG